MVSGLQLLEFGNHLSLAPLLLMPIFFICQSIFTLMIFQIVILSLTALAVFFIVKSLTRSPLLGLAFCLAFLLSPGIYSIYIYGFHPESMLLLPYLVIFYSFMKMNKKLFLSSSLLLLATMEVAPFMAATLGAGLFAFAYLYTPDKNLKRQRMILSVCLIVLSVAALLLYSHATTSLLGSESTGQYAGIPPIIKLVPFAAQQTSSLSHVGSSLSTDYSKFSLLNGAFVIYALWVAFLTFGIAVLFCPELAIVFGAQWLAELFIVRNYNFTVMWYPYFTFVLGGTLIAAVIGMNLAGEKRGYMSKLFAKMAGKNYKPLLMKMTLGTLVVSIIALNLLYPFFISSKAKSSTITDFTQAFLFQTGPQQRLMYRQLDSMIRLLPPNASVMTQFYIVPHLINRQNIELIPNSGSGLSQHNFIPAYILVDFNASVVPYIELAQVPIEEASTSSFMNNQTGGYSLYAQNGTAMLYKWNGGLI